MPTSKVRTVGSKPTGIVLVTKTPVAVEPSLVSRMVKVTVSQFSICVGPSTCTPVPSSVMRRCGARSLRGSTDRERIQGETASCAEAGASRWKLSFAAALFTAPDSAAGAIPPSYQLGKTCETPAASTEATGKGMIPISKEISAQILKSLRLFIVLGLLPPPGGGKDKLSCENQDDGKYGHRRVAS